MKNIVEVLRELEKAPHTESGIAKSLNGLDERLRDAAHKDMGALFSNIVTDMAMRHDSGAHSIREHQILTVFGWQTIKHPYHKDIKNVSPVKLALGLLGKDTPAARDWMARCGALGGSFKEGRDTLLRLTGVEVSTSKLRKAVLECGTACLQEQEKALPDVRTYSKAPAGEGLTKVPKTLFCMADGTGAPCTNKDTDGIKGKNGAAGTRSIRILLFGEYEWLDKNARPVPYSDSFSYAVSGESMTNITGLMRKLGVSRGYGTAARVQCVADGEVAIEKAMRDAFPEAIFTNDFMHASSHLHSCCEHLTLQKKEYRFIRGLLLRHGAKSAIKRIKNRYKDALVASEDAAKELKYLEKREANMCYGKLRKSGFFIASGHIEAAARVLVARRCKQAGMHWRHTNAIKVSAILARIRSGTFKVA
ncbi:MAG: hypothetical protein KAH38_02470 [Candidatus Hydrogenedentes bacterium]|nr:hypothetical protein [Candidatus Hydrogenedentota bacterium]